MRVHSDSQWVHKIFPFSFSRRRSYLNGQLAFLWFRCFLSTQLHSLLPPSRSPSSFPSGFPSSIPSLLSLHTATLHTPFRPFEVSGASNLLLSLRRKSSKRRRKNWQEIMGWWINAARERMKKDLNQLNLPLLRQLLLAYLRHALRFRRTHRDRRYLRILLPLVPTHSFKLPSAIGS